jgi:hypothetical protein
MQRIVKKNRKKKREEDSILSRRTLNERPDAE